MRSDYWDKPAFETIRPRRLTAPIVFNSAHSGRDYPERFLKMTRLDHLSIRQSEDAWVDELLTRAPHLGTPLLRAHFPRAYLDVNREPWELDPQMFIEPLSDRFNTTSPRVAAGLGTLARVVAENKPIYRELLTLAARLEIEMGEADVGERLPGNGTRRHLPVVDPGAERRGGDACLQNAAPREPFRDIVMVGRRDCCIAEPDLRT